MTVTAMNSFEQFQELINSGKIIIIDFWATWCGPCRMISPIFEQFSDKHAVDGVEFVTVDVDEQPEIAQEVGIKAMPTFMVFKDGEKIGELVGANPPALQVLVQKHTQV